MLTETFYLSNDENIERALELTGLDEEELETVVGRFSKDHYRFAGQLKGLIAIDYLGYVSIRHHFKQRKILWME